jgi:DNA-binding NarL/FixJ family response regulator
VKRVARAGPGGRPDHKGSAGTPSRGRPSRHNTGVGASVLIVDDHPDFRRNARRLLERRGYIVVGEAEDGESGISEAERLHPEVVLLDVYLPDTDGFDVAEKLTSRTAAIVVLISSRDGRDFGPLVERSGARGFIAKTELSGPRLGELLES